MTTVAPGVHRVVEPPAVVRELLESDGWRVATLDARSRADLFDQLAAVLGRPMGANLDALWDVLREVDVPLALVWDGWADLGAADPGWFRRLLRLVDARAAEPGPPVCLVLL